MKIDLDWIQKELDAGREVKLEGINGGYINKDNYILSIDSDGLVVSIGTGKMWLSPDSLKHFRIKRSTPTFDDLIDIATQAVRDKILISLEFTNSSIHYISKDRLPEKNRHGLSCRGKYLGISGLSPNMQIHYIKKEIDLIKSLYTETFVIGKFDDLKKINLKNSVVKFLNGFESQIKSVDWQSDGGNISLYDGEFYVDFDIIKGATVTQQKGNK